MEYKDYITDFSDRAKKVLEKFSKCDTNNELNVTALLSIATSAFVIPFERLKKEHPFMDRKNFETIGKKIDDEQKENAKNSSLFSGESWKIITDTNKNFIDKNDFNDELFKDIGVEDVQYIISIIRNALAHGNIKTGVVGNTIEKLYFASRNNIKKCDDIALEEFKAEEKLTTKKMQSIIRKMQTCKEREATYKILQCSVEDFKSFVCNWINLLIKAQEVSEKES